METTLKPVNLQAEAIKAGVIWGVINIILFLLGYYLMFEVSNSFWFGGVKILIGILLAVYFCSDLRKKAGGYWTFSEALKYIFIMFLVAAAISYFFTILFSKLEPDYAVRMKELMMTQMEEMFKKFGLSEDQMTEALTKQDEAMQKQFNPNLWQMLVGFGITAIFYFIGALIFAAIFKKQKPLFLEEETVTIVE